MLVRSPGRISIISVSQVILALKKYFFAFTSAYMWNMEKELWYLTSSLPFSAPSEQIDYPSSPKCLALYTPVSFPLSFGEAYVKMRCIDFTFICIGITSLRRLTSETKHTVHVHPEVAGFLQSITKS